LGIGVGFGGVGSSFEHSEAPFNEFQLLHRVPIEGVAAVRGLEPGQTDKTRQTLRSPAHSRHNGVHTLKVRKHTL
jgi:hypothetical protein